MTSLIRYLYRIKRSVILFGLADYRMAGRYTRGTYTKYENRNEKTREVDSSCNSSHFHSTAAGFESQFRHRLF
jgi:hypothetical protein